MPYTGIPIQDRGVAGGVASLNEAAHVIADELASNAHVVARSDGSPTENGQALLDAYQIARQLTPGSSALSSSNRAAVLVLPGVYELPDELTLDQEYVDLVGVGDRSEVRIEGRVAQTVDDVTIRNLYMDEYWPDSNLPEAHLEQVETGSMRSAITYAGTYIDVKDNGDMGFGGDWGGEASGTFIRCSGGEQAFAGSAYASGTFIDCEGGYGSFSGGVNDMGFATGTFIRCKGGERSFGGFFSEASGEFFHCEAGPFSFGGDGGYATGTFVSCEGGEMAFGGDGQATGTFRDCIGGDMAFGAWWEASGRFQRCTGGVESFGGYAEASGIFEQCVGDFESFGRFGTLSGQLHYCRLTDGSFEEPSDDGKIVLCTDGSGRIVNREAEMSMGGEKITDLASPSEDEDAATKQYVDDQVAE